MSNQSHKKLVDAVAEFAAVAQMAIADDTHFAVKCDQIMRRLNRLKQIVAGLANHARGSGHRRTGGV